MLGKRPVPGCPTIRIRVGHGSTALLVGTGGGGLDILYLSSIVALLFYVHGKHLRSCRDGQLT